MNILSITYTIISLNMLLSFIGLLWAFKQDNINRMELKKYDPNSVIFYMYQIMKGLTFTNRKTFKETIYTTPTGYYIPEVMEELKRIEIGKIT